MGGEGIVYNPVDWRHATTTELEGQRVIARFDNGTVVDGTIIIAPGGAIGVYMGVMVPIIEKSPVRPIGGSRPCERIAGVGLQ